MEELMTVVEVAEYLKQKPEVIRRKLRNSEISGVKISRKQWRITKQAVMDYLNKT